MNLTVWWSQCCESWAHQCSFACISSISFLVETRASVLVLLFLFLASLLQSACFFYLGSSENESWIPQLMIASNSRLSACIICFLEILKSPSRLKTIVVNSMSMSFCGSEMLSTKLVAVANKSESLKLALRCAPRQGVSRVRVR